MHIRHAKSGRALRTTRPVTSIATVIRHHELLSTSSGPKFTSVLPTVEARRVRTSTNVWSASQHTSANWLRRDVKRSNMACMSRNADAERAKQS